MSCEYLYSLLYTSDIQFLVILPITNMSQFFTLNTKDLIKSLIMAFLGAFITWIYNLIAQGGIITLESLKSIAFVWITAMLAYLIKNYFTNSQGELKSEPQLP